MKKSLQIIITLCLITISSVASAQYTIIVDAGSSGSRLHLYKHNHAIRNNVPVIEDVFTEKTQPGLSSYANNPSAAGDSLKPLLDDAAKQLQTKHIPQVLVSVSVMGTAGMRLLPESTQQAIYADVRQFIKDNYAFRVDEVETISGKMEGVYGWLDINYLSHQFDQKNDTTYGSIDMGGASTEIAFSTLDTSKAADKVTINLGGKTYTVFSQSFLGLGEDQALASINANAQANTCYPINYSVNGSIGNFNFPTCGTLYTNLITQYHIAEQMLPVPSQTFIAYSGVTYVAQFLKVGEHFDQIPVETSIQTICYLSWEQIQAAYPGQSATYLSQYCADSVLMDKLFFDTYHLQTNQILVKKDINGTDIDWALGALLYRLIS